MIGARREGRTIDYPVSDLAGAHGGSVEVATDDPGAAYAPVTPWRLGRPDVWGGLPWA